MRKRVLVFSDSHGDSERLEDALRLGLKKGRADIAVHLGDGHEDFDRLRSLLEATHTEGLCVQGNQDWFCLAPLAIEFEVNGVVFFACHGHTLGVKTGLERLWYTAMEKGASVALYGHTHIPREELRDGVLLLNPGSVKDRGTFTNACTELLIEEDGRISVNRIPWG